MSGLATVGVVVLTAVLTWIGHAVLTSQQRRLNVAIALEQRKRDLYKQFLTFFFNVLKQQKGGKVLNNDELASSLMDMTKDMAIYASDEVLRLFLQLRTMALEEEQDPAQIIELFGKIIRQIRKDLGHSMTRIEPKDILTLFITDIDKLYPRQKEI